MQLFVIYFTDNFLCVLDRFIHKNFNRQKQEKSNKKHSTM